MSEQVETVVVGAGVVGLAVARELALAGQDVLVLEREGGIGKGISSRNSEVIHAGLYYPAGSLKARHCVQGRQALYDYCRARHIPYRQCGKLVTATDEDQIETLNQIYQSGVANGVEDLSIIGAAELKKKEPALHGVAALWVPVSGIIDSHAYMLALQGDLENAGGNVVFRAPVDRIEAGDTGFTVRVGDTIIHADNLVNCAGLQAPVVAGMIAAMPRDKIPKSYMAKGSYFTLSRKCPFTHLIYPLPEPGGLGIHLTLDMGGQGRFGPDVEWIEEEGYEVDPGRGERFYNAIRRYWPDLQEGDLQPGYAGIRPKISGAGEAPADFLIHGPEAHGLRGLVHLFGIESPGLTASLALANAVKNKLIA